MSIETDVQKKRLQAYLKQVLASHELVALILNSSIIYHILLQFIVTDEKLLCICKVFCWTFCGTQR